MMNKKAQYYPKKGHPFLTGFFIILLLGLVTFGVFYYFGYIKMEDIKQMTTKIKLPDSKPVYNPITLNNEVTWCQKQNINTGVDLNTPLSITILGYEQENNCCVKRYNGVYCSDKTIVDIDVCKSGDIGGDIIWTRFNNVFIDNGLALQLIQSLKKDVKVCI